MNILEKLKNKWQIQSNRQFGLILLVFALAGSSVVWVRRPIFEALGVSSETPLYFSAPLYLITVFPVYCTLLLAWGFLFGQFPFFWAFVRKMLSRFGL